MDKLKGVIKNMNATKFDVFQAIAKTTADKPYIQCPTMIDFKLKYKPIDSISRVEVYQDSVLINDNYKIADYELKQYWNVV